MYWQMVLMGVLLVQALKQQKAHKRVLKFILTTLKWVWYDCFKVSNIVKK